MAISGIDFTRITLKDALDLAILMEDEAKQRYTEFADQMEQHRTPEAASFFRFMASNEAKHGEELAARRKSLFADQPSSVSSAQLYDVEAPDYDAARAFMRPRAAMETALNSEVKAYDFFVAALPGITDSSVKALFEELRDEESEHQSLINIELAKLPPDPGFSEEEFVDGPAPQ
jgi:rubrerythrin